MWGCLQARSLWQGSLDYLGTADHQLLKFTIVGPKRSNTTTELVPDWTKANYDAMKKEIGEMD